MSLPEKLNLEAAFWRILLLFLSVFLFYLLDPAVICFLQEIIPGGFSQAAASLGGFNELLAMKILSWFHYAGLGYVLIGLLFLLFYTALQYLWSKNSKHPYFHPAIFLTGLALLLPLFNYNFPFTITTSILFSTLVLALFVRLTSRFKKAGPIAVFPGLVLIYYMFGLPGFYFTTLVMAARTGIPLILRVLYGTFGLVIPLISLMAGLNFTLLEAFFEPFTSTLYHSIGPTGFFIYPLSLLMMILLGTTGKKESIVHWSIPYGIPLILAALSFFLAFNKMEKQVYQVECAALEGEWDLISDIVEEGQIPLSRSVQFQNNRALYHQGFLLTKLLDQVQHYGIDGLFLNESNNGTSARSKAGLYLEMAYSNESRHWANEALTALGPHPDILKCLITNYEAAGEKAIAERYKTLLKQSSPYKSWIVDNNEKERLARNFPEEDFFTRTDNPLKMMEDFIASNPDNKMAFEYLVAGYLLSHNIGRVVAKISNFKQLGYENLPRIVQEAFLIYMVRTNDTRLSLMGYTIDKECQEQFKDFSVKFQQAGGKAQAKELVKEYQNTYWYFIIFDRVYSNPNN